MSLDAISFNKPVPPATGSSAVVSLDERLNRLGGASRDNNSAEYDADYEAFYTALMAAQEGFNAQEFLRNYVGADGEKTFKTTGAQMEVLQEVMAKLKEDQQQDGLAYELAGKAFSSAFSMNFMLQSFMHEAMNPSNDEESRENVVW